MPKAPSSNILQSSKTSTNDTRTKQSKISKSSLNKQGKNVNKRSSLELGDVKKTESSNSAKKMKTPSKMNRTASSRTWSDSKNSNQNIPEVTGSSSTSGKAPSDKLTALKEELVGQEVGGDVPTIVIEKHSTDVAEHSSDTLCCLTLKVWATALMEISHNSYAWTKWARILFKQIKDYAATVRGNVILPNGEKKVLLKREWRHFVNEIEQQIDTWREYSSHVKELSAAIIDDCRGKTIICCPKCLEDNLIKDVVEANHVYNSLKQAVIYASEWRNTLEKMVTITDILADCDQEKQADDDKIECHRGRTSYRCVCGREVTGILERVRIR